MSGLPEGYGYKDLTSLGVALEENKRLREKLDIAIRAIEQAKEEIEDNPDLTISLFYLILRNALTKIENIK